MHAATYTSHRSAAATTGSDLFKSAVTLSPRSVSNIPSCLVVVF
jgi:hypothetical protein